MRTLVCHAFAGCAWVMAWAAPQPAARAQAAESDEAGARQAEVATGEVEPEEAAGEARAAEAGATLEPTELEGDQDADVQAACLPVPVEVRRFGADEHASLRLTDCKGRPDLEALAALSALAQPLTGREPEPVLPDVPAAAFSTAPAAVQLNPELLLRLQQLSQRFPGRPIEIVSGYRPNARPHSRHHSGDALDLRIEGVDNLELSEFARTLEATGVGFYPNSTFVHIDVRDASAYWVDRSGPGQQPDYGPWPAADAAANASEPDPELQALAVRALVVMNEALQREATALPDTSVL